MPMPDPTTYHFNECCFNCEHKHLPGRSEICVACLNEETPDNYFPRFEPEKSNAKKM